MYVSTCMCTRFFFHPLPVFELSRFLERAKSRQTKKQAKARSKTMETRSKRRERSNSRLRTTSFLSLSLSLSMGKNKNSEFPVRSSIGCKPRDFFTCSAASSFLSIQKWQNASDERGQSRSPLVHVPVYNRARVHSSRFNQGIDLKETISRVRADLEDSLNSLVIALSFLLLYKTYIYSSRSRTKAMSVRNEAFLERTHACNRVHRFCELCNDV